MHRPRSGAPKSALKSWLWTLGLALGAYAGWRRGGTVDRVGNGLGLILYSMPYFVIGLPLIIIFATTLGWFPTSGMLTPGATSTACMACSRYKCICAYQFAICWHWSGWKPPSC